MTVAELIEKLREIPQDMPVKAYWGYDAELDDVRDIEVAEDYTADLVPGGEQPKMVTFK